MYQGWVELPLSDSELAAYYQGQLHIENIVTLKENQYLLLSNNGSPLTNEIWKCKNGKLSKVGYSTVGSDSSSSIAKPRNPQQVMEFDMINDKSISLKLVTGTWGAFKTGALVRAALKALEENDFDRIVYIRNNVQVKDTDSLGALPGDVYDKILPYVGPFVDVCGDEGMVRDMYDRKQLEIMPLGYLRGRNLEHSLILVDEAENLTLEQLQLIIARAAQGSQVWINGDIRQRDRVSFEKSKGIETMIERLQGQPLFGYVHLIKSERSELAALADLLKD